MSVTLTNPLDQFQNLIYEVIALTYQYVVHPDYPPTLDEVYDHVAPHFFQELALEIVMSECFFIVGADDYPNFLEMLEDGEYDRFVPNKETVRIYLNEMNMSYLERGDHGYQLRNSSIIEVW